MKGFSLSIQSVSDPLAAVTRPHTILGDLEGLKVAHDMEALDEGEEKILTLKDSRILENEGERGPLCVAV